MISIVYPYRDRDVNRVKKSLNSLMTQTNLNFEVHFIDYGSNQKKAQEIKKLVTGYDFVTYHYSYHLHTLWNKSRALNIVIKQLVSPFCFIADVDMIFHPQFIEVLHNVKNEDKVTYFQVGFLSEEESLKDEGFEDYKIKFTSLSGATGLSLFPVKSLKKVNGFDEYYHLWGAEDTDIHNRLKLSGLSVEFYDSKILLLHQFHKIYRSFDDKKLSEQITIKNIAKLNHEYCSRQLSEKKAIVNNCGVWGEIQSLDEYKRLLSPNQVEVVVLKKEIFNKWILTLKHNTNNEIILYQLKGSSSWLGNCMSKIKGMYTLKEASDLLLLNHIEHLRNKKYLYRVSDDYKKIEYTLCQK